MQSEGDLQGSVNTEGELSEMAIIMTWEVAGGGFNAYPKVDVNHHDGSSN